MITQRVNVMLIDFHTHIFPTKIADMAIKVLKAGMLKEQGYCIEPQYDGTVDGLKAMMQKNNIDISVTLPIATRPKNTASINTFVKGITDSGIISFATVHPESDNYREELEQIAESGFKGIKLHPEFQHFYIDSKESVDILQTAEKLGLYVVIHAGADIGMPPPVHCTPKMLKNVLSYISGKYLIAAHLGGYGMWDDVEKYLCGTEIYMDTAFLSRIIDGEQLKRIIKSHGSDKILFGSDAPWENPADTVAMINSLGLDRAELDNIFYKNAQRILF